MLDELQVQELVGLMELVLLPVRYCQVLDLADEWRLMLGCLLQSGLNVGILLLSDVKEIWNKLARGVDNVRHVLLFHKFAVNCNTLVAQYQELTNDVRSILFGRWVVNCELIQVLSLLTLNQMHVDFVWHDEVLVAQTYLAIVILRLFIFFVH